MASLSLIDVADMVVNMNGKLIECRTYNNFVSIGTDWSYKSSYYTTYKTFVNCYEIYSNYPQETIILARMCKIRFLMLRVI